MSAIYEALRIGMIGLTTNKVRSALTMLGIIIGVTAVIALVSIGQGFSSYVNSQFSSLGTNVLFVSRSRQVDNPQQLTMGDAKALEDPVRASGVQYVAPSYQGSVEAIVGNQKTNTNAIGVTPEYLGVRAYTMKTGRFITSDDVDHRTRVAVLGYTTAGALFPNDAYPVGQTVRVNNIAFDVIGVLAQKGGSGPQNNDDVIMVPLITAQTRLFSAATVRGEYVVTNINIEAKSKDVMDATMEQIRAILRGRHRLTADAPDDFNIFNQADLMATLGNITSTLTLFLGAIAAISLLVGGIGIMNIMLVSVTERTREIGLRKAIGAGRSDILLQFLIESLTLSLLGGLLGVGLGMLASRMIGPALNVRTTVTPGSVMLAVTFSAAVGVVFGIYPAMRAAALRPIEALRYE